MDSIKEIKPLEGLVIENGTVCVQLHRGEAPDIHDGKDHLEHVQSVLVEVEEAPQFKYWLAKLSPGREVPATFDGDVIEVRSRGRINNYQ